MWVYIAIVAAVAQTARNAIARSLTPHVSSALVSWSRFAFNLPFALILLAVVHTRMGSAHTPPNYFVYCAIAAVTQLLGNVCLVAAFRSVSFAHAIVFFKLEVLFTAIAGAVVFGETPSRVGWLGVVLCAVGVIWINLAETSRPPASSSGGAGLLRAFRFDRGAMLALVSGLWLVIASFALKAANTALAAANPRVGTDRFEVAVNTLFHVTWMEVALLSAWLFWREREELTAIAIHWKRMATIGFMSFLGSLGWFWAFSLTLVAYVKAVGQLEALFAVVLAVTVWHEHRVFRQIPGIVVILVGVGLVLLG